MDWIRASFPDSITSLPRGEYVRIRHPLRSEVSSGPLLRRLPSDLLFFDLETLGFLGHPLFLVGVLLRGPRSRRWEVIQFLARDYTEEEAILSAFAHQGRRRKRWVSFNGKSFDLPFLRHRAAFYGVRLPEPAEHLDLLHLARRVYGGILPDCRLATLESNLLGRSRRGDLGGAEIPAAYHAFVRTGEPEKMERILAHNRQDLISLARLLIHLVLDEDEEEPETIRTDTLERR